MADSIRDESILGDPEFANLIDELTEQMQSHRELDLENYLERYPQYADQLEQLVPAMEMLICQGNGPGEGDTGQTETQASAPLGTTGGKLGDFRIIREIGRGGMGVVYEVEQLSLKRRMALKVLPFAGILDEQALKRFKNEALAAATLNHPNIVQVHSVGCDRGVHYYAMQLIEGQTLANTITELRRFRKHRSNGQADEISDVGTLSAAIAAGSFQPQASDDDVPVTEPSKLPPAPSPVAETKPELKAAASTVPSLESTAYFRTVANLGIQAAKALDHAHANGISHRDIKPGNLMIDGTGKLWVTDFGLARIEASAPMTMTGDMLGTLRYMCPEMAAGGRERLVVDQRTDIYSLGVTLYELLTLEPAFEGKDRKELLQKIIFSDPRPPRRISRSIPANLETIVLKAMRKDPADRYATAGELANDLNRFLDNEPIRAKPPTLVERTLMWSRRNRSIVAAAAILLLVATIGSLIATGLVWQEQLRTANALQQSRENEQKAELKATESKAVVDFLINKLLGSAAPNRSKDNPVTVNEVLTNAEANIETAFVDQPLVEASVRHVMGVVYNSLGHFDSAERHLRRARHLRNSLLGIRHSDTVATMSAWALALKHVGMYDEARALHEKVLEIRQRTLGEEHPATLDSMNNLATLLEKKGKYKESRALTENALEIQRRTLGEEHPASLYSMNNLGTVLSKLGNIDEARAIHEQVLEIRQRTLGDDHPATLSSMINLGTALARQGKYEEAQAYWEQVREHHVRRLGAEHRDTLMVTNNLAFALESQGKYDEARALYEQTLEILRRTLGADHATTLMLMNNLARARHAEGELDQALALFEQIVEISRRTLGEEHPRTLQYMMNVAGCLGAQGNHDEAFAVFDELFEIQKRTLGEEHPNMLKLMNNLANSLRHQGKYDEASAIFERVVEIQQRTLGGEHPDTLLSMHNLATTLYNQREIDQARDLMEKVLKTRLQTQSAKHPYTVKAMRKLAEILTDQGDFARACDLRREVLALYRIKPGAEHADTLDLMVQLAYGLMMQGKLAAAEEYYEQVLEIRRDKLGPNNSATVESLICMAYVLLQQEKFDKACEYYEQVRDLGRNTLGADNPDMLNSMSWLALLYNEQGEYEKAMALAKETLERLQGVEGAEYECTLRTKTILAESLEGLGRLSEARLHWTELLDLSERNPDLPDWQKSAFMSGLALNMVLTEDSHPDAMERASELAQTAVELDPDAGESWQSLGVVQAVSGQWKESLDAFHKAIELGYQDELLPSTVLQRIDNTENQSEEHFQRLMKLVRKK